MKPGSKRAAAFCFLSHHDKYLLLKRTKTPYYGKYAPIGGSLEPFETPDQAIIRETMEEAQVMLNDIRFCGILTETSPVQYNWISFVYTSEIPWYEPPLCDEGILMWVEKSEAPSLDIPPPDLIIYQYLKEGRQFVLDAIYNEQMELVSMIEKLSGDIVV